MVLRWPRYALHHIIVQMLWYNFLKKDIAWIFHIFQILSCFNMVALWSFNINIFQKKNYFFVVSLSNIIVPPISCARAQSSRDSWQTITKIYPKFLQKISCNTYSIIKKIKDGRISCIFWIPENSRPSTHYRKHFQLLRFQRSCYFTE